MLDVANYVKKAVTRPGNGKNSQGSGVSNQGKMISLSKSIKSSEISSSSNKVKSSSLQSSSDRSKQKAPAHKGNVVKAPDGRKVNSNIKASELGPIGNKSAGPAPSIQTPAQSELDLFNNSPMFQPKADQAQMNQKKENALSHKLAHKPPFENVVSKGATGGGESDNFIASDCSVAAVSDASSSRIIIADNTGNVMTCNFNSIIDEKESKIKELQMNVEHYRKLAASKDGGNTEVLSVLLDIKNHLQGFDERVGRIESALDQSKLRTSHARVTCWLHKHFDKCDTYASSSDT